MLSKPAFNDLKQLSPFRHSDMYEGLQTRWKQIDGSAACVGLPCVDKKQQQLVPYNPDDKRTYSYSLFVTFQFQQRKEIRCSRVETGGDSA